jgi:hypothetical protein
VVPVVMDFSREVTGARRLEMEDASAQGAMVNSTTNPLHHQQLVMGPEEPMPVLLEHQVLFKRRWVYIIKKSVLTTGRETIFQEFINQCPV